MHIWEEHSPPQDLKDGAVIKPVYMLSFLSQTNWETSICHLLKSHNSARVNNLTLIKISESFLDLPQVYFQTPANKREPKPQQNPSEERMGGEIDLLGSLSHEY